MKFFVFNLLNFKNKVYNWINFNPIIYFYLATFE